MQLSRDGVGRAVLLQAVLCFGLLWLLDAADESPDQFALPDFSIYHTKYECLGELATAFPLFICNEDAGSICITHICWVMQGSGVRGG